MVWIGNGLDRPVIEINENLTKLQLFFFRRFVFAGAATCAIGLTGEELGPPQSLRLRGCCDDVRCTGKQTYHRQRG